MKNRNIGILESAKSRTSYWNVGMKIFFLISFFLFSFSTFAQPRGRKPMQENVATQSKRQDKVEAFKVGFITERLNLTPEEAKIFWPVYNKYQDELEGLRKSRRENLINAKQNFDEMGDKDVEKAVDAELGYRQNELDLLKKYHPQFKQVLPIKKVAKLYRAEEDFKRKLLEMIQERRMDKK
jgi:hypothetical protein